LSELRHPGDEIGGGRFSKARYALDDLGTLGKVWRDLDPGRDCGLEFDDFAGQVLQDASMRFLNQSRCSMLVPSLQASLVINQSYARFH